MKTDESRKKMKQNSNSDAKSNSADTQNAGESEILMKGDQAGSLDTLKKVMKFIGRYKILLLLSLILAAVTVVLQLYVPILFGDAIDGIVGKGKVDFGIIRYYGAQIMLLVVISSLATWMMNIINNRLTYRVVRDIRSRAIRQIQVLPLSWLDAHQTGDIVGRVIADADQLSDGLLLGFTQLFSGVVTIAVTLVFMFSKSVVITLFVLVMTPVSFLVAKFISTRSYKMFGKQTQARGRQTALIEEMIGNEKIVKAFGYGARASERFEEINQELQEYSWRAVFFSSLTNPSTRAVNSVIYAFVTLIGAMHILSGRLTVGGLSVLLSYANQYMKPFNDISSVITELQNALSCAARIFALIEAKPQSADPAQELPAAEGKVEIKDLAFSYDKKKPLIEHFKVTAEPGTKVAIVGPTGCGKTTFINLLMRFYDADGGTIDVDGHSIYDVSRHSLRRSYGMVLQDTWLKSGTVRENIAFGKPDATDEEIINAAKEAHSWGFIRRLPKGLDTVIGNDSLSQGQRQLLCITRVMLCLPPMLILDEATSSIDTRTEMQIQNAFDKLMKGRTSFVVAHRLSTIRSADIILVMKDGKIIEQGTHDGLMAKGGFYAQLYNAQFAGVQL